MDKPMTTIAARMERIPCHTFDPENMSDTTPDKLSYQVSSGSGMVVLSSSPPVISNVLLLTTISF